MCVYVYYIDQSERVVAFVSRLQEGWTLDDYNQISVHSSHIISFITHYSSHLKCKTILHNIYLCVIKLQWKIMRIFDEFLKH